MSSFALTGGARCNLRQKAAEWPGKCLAVEQRAQQPGIAWWQHKDWGSGGTRGEWGVANNTEKVAKKLLPSKMEEFQ